MPDPSPLAIIEIEVGDDDQLDRLLTIRNQVEPRTVTIAGYRAETTAAVEHLELLATWDGRDVGAAVGGWGAILAEFGETFLEAWVLPEARRQGVGTALVDRLTSFARTHGMTDARAFTRAGDDASLRFAARYGLEPTGGGQEGSLDLGDAHATTSVPLPPGIELTTLAERPDLLYAVYELNVAVRPEIPSAAGEPTPSFEAWDEQTTGDPGFLAELTVLAVREGRLVGSVQIYDNAEDTAFIGMTAVDPDARRQGIARALKVELARRAVSSGWRRIETYNDGANTRMRALNESLGYVYLPASVNLKGRLPTG